MIVYQVRADAGVTQELDWEVMPDDPSDLAKQIDAGESVRGRGWPTQMRVSRKPRKRTDFFFIGLPWVFVLRNSARELLKPALERDCEFIEIELTNDADNACVCNIVRTMTAIKDWTWPDPTGTIPYPRFIPEELSAPALFRDPKLPRHIFLASNGDDDPKDMLHLYKLHHMTGLNFIPVWKDRQARCVSR